MKKVISLLLTIMIIMSLVPSLVYAQSNTEVERYTVLVLDTSGGVDFRGSADTIIYSADTAIEYVKQSANKFISALDEDDAANYVALVTFDSSAKNISDFSADFSYLSDKVNNLSSSTRNSSNIAEGLKKAKEILSKISNDNAQKNVVLFTTGFTMAGDYTYTGKYDDTTVGSNWRNTSNGVRLYAYANVAYNEATEIKEDATLYSVGLFNNFEAIPEEGKNALEFFKLTALDLASSEEYFYEVEDPSKLEIAFGDIADKIINPLSITLGHSLIDEMVTKKIDDVTTQYYDHYLYTIIAQVKNTANQTAKNVVCTFELPDEAIPFDEMISSTPEKVINVGDILAGESKTVSWDIEIKWPTNDISAIYGVHAKADNTVDMYQTNIIYVPAKQKNDNAFIFGTDQWSFSNSNDFFDPNGNETYYITDSDYDGLVYNLSNVEKENVDDLLDDSWGGSCYGMSATSILTKMGVYKAEEIQTGKSTLNSITKTNNDSVESFINYYHATQMLNPVLNERSQFNLLNDEEKLQRIESQAMDIANGASPFIISIRNDNGGHAMVAYGHETGSWKFGGFLGIGETEYNSRILIYDCNHPNDKDDSCLYYNAGSTDWYMPHYDVDDLTRANANIEIIDCKNHEVNTTNQQAYIKSKNLTGYTIIINDISYEITPDTFDKDLGMTTYFIDKSDNASPEMILVLPALTRECTVSIEDESDFELSLNYDNISLSADVNSADKIGFKPNGTVSLEGNEGDFELSLVANEGYHTTPWYKTSISGTNTDDVEISQNQEGIIIEGDNLDDLKITTKDATQETAQLINTDEKNILLTSDVEDNPIIMFDSDDDGTYDKQIETYILEMNASTGGKIISEHIEKYSENAIVEIEAETNSDYTFEGWTSSNGGIFEDASSLKTKFTMPANDTIITAKFNRKSSGGGRLNTTYTVNFETNGGNEITRKIVAANERISEPVAPEKEGYTFEGWYTDKELTKEYDFDTKVTKNFILYAKWVGEDNSQIILTIGEKEAIVFGEVKENDVAPKIVNDRTMLPIRFIAEALGAMVEWDEATRKITILKDDIEIVITIDSEVAVVNGENVTLDSPAFIENDRTYLPLRFVSENLGAKVEWIEEEQKVIISK